MRHSLLTLSLLASLCSAGFGLAPADSAPDPPDWCFLVYMCADNDLERDGVRDFFEMAGVGSTARVDIVVQFDRHPAYDRRFGDWRDTRRFHVTRGCTPDPGQEFQLIGEANMGRGPRQSVDDGSLEDFVRWGMTRFPSRRTALIIWDHGDGWKSLHAPLPPYKGVGEDWTDADWMSMAEVRTALANAAADGFRVDLLGFDACDMGMIEVAYELRDVTDVMVGSERFEWSTGWPYDTILADLVAHPDLDAAGLGSVIVQRYGEAIDWLTLSAVDMAEVPALSRAVSDLGLAITSQRSRIEALRKKSRKYDSYDGGFNYLDLQDFAEHLVAELPPGPIPHAAQAVLRAMPAAVIDRVPFKGRDHGLAFYFPRLPEDLDDAYAAETIQFARDGFWDEFLAWYHGRTRMYWVGEPRAGGTVELRVTGPAGATPVLCALGANVLDPPRWTPWGDWYLQPPLAVAPAGVMPPDGILIQRCDLPPGLPTPWDAPLQTLVGDALTNLCVVPIR